MANCDAKSMAAFLEQDLEKKDNPREQRMVERLMLYNMEVRYVPGKRMEVPDFGSRHPIFMENHKLFETDIGSLGIFVRSKRVQSLDLKDPKIEILARVASGDQNYLRDIV